MGGEAFIQAQAGMLAASGVAATSRFVPVKGGRAHVLTHGSGPPVVLVNGIGTPAAMWAPLMARMEGVTAHAVDLPGFGLSERDQPLGPALRRDATGLLADVLDGLELERATVVANSLGALFATWLALDRPERVSALAWVGCPALLLATAAPAPMRLLSVRGLGAVLERLQPPSPKQVDGLAKMVHEHPLPDELRALLVATERLPSFRATFRPLLRQLLRLRGARPPVALTAAHLAALRQPVAVVWGENDPFGSVAVGRRAAELIPRASFYQVPGGHAPWIHHADEVAAAVVPFLHEHAAAAVRGAD